MSEYSSEFFRLRISEILERTRDLCAKRVPNEIFRYTGSQLRMINQIYTMTRSGDEGLQLKQLASALEITPAAASEMVETLVRRGALERRSNPSDRRAIALRLAPEWEERFRTFERQLDTLFEQFFDQVSGVERETAGKVFGQLAAFMAEQKTLPEVKP